jgi:hypothetical protein
MGGLSSEQDWSVVQLQWGLNIIRRTDSVDASKCPVHNGDLDEAGPYASNYLTREDGFRWNLHVVRHLMNC